MTLAADSKPPLQQQYILNKGGALLPRQLGGPAEGQLRIQTMFPGTPASETSILGKICPGSHAGDPFAGCMLWHLIAVVFPVLLTRQTWTTILDVVQVMED